MRGWMIRTKEIQKTPLWLFEKSLYTGCSVKQGEVKNPYLKGNRPFYCLAHHPSPPQTLNVLQVADGPHKTCCPELSTGSRQTLIRTVPRGSLSSSIWTLYPFLTEPKIVGIFLMATSHFCFIRSLCSWLFSHWLPQTWVSTSLVYTFFISWNPSSSL